MWSRHFFISIFSNLKRDFAFWLLLKPIFVLEERKCLSVCCVSCDVFVNNYLTLKNFAYSLEPGCIQPRNWKKGELDIWLIPGHGATLPPRSFCKDFIKHSASPLVLESRLICTEWDFGHLWISQSLSLSLPLSPLPSPPSIVRMSNEWVWYLQ